MIPLARLLRRSMMLYICTIPSQYLTVLKDEAGFFADACHADCSPPSGIASVKGQLLDMDEAFLLLARQQLQPSKVVTARLLRSRQPLKELLLCDLAHAQQQKIADSKRKELAGKAASVLPGSEKLNCTHLALVTSDFSKFSYHKVAASCPLTI